MHVYFPITNMFKAAKDYSISRQLRLQALLSIALLASMKEKKYLIQCVAI